MKAVVVGREGKGRGGLCGGNSNWRGSVWFPEPPDHRGVRAPSLLADDPHWRETSLLLRCIEDVARARM